MSNVYEKETCNVLVCKKCKKGFLTSIIIGEYTNQKVKKTWCSNSFCSYNEITKMEAFT